MELLITIAYVFLVRLVFFDHRNGGGSAACNCAVRFRSDRLQ